MRYYYFISYIYSALLRELILHKVFTQVYQNLVTIFIKIFTHFITIRTQKMRYTRNIKIW